MKFNENITLAEAKELLRGLLDKGHKCPCCNRFTKMYKRNITSSMAFGLLLIFKEGPVHQNSNGYIHIENMFKDLIGVPASIRADLPKLRFWGLLQPEGHELEDKNPNNGYYKITENGKLFVEGKIMVPGKVKLYDNRFFGYCDKSPDINIRQALGNKFSYDKLMGLEQVV